MPKKSLLSEKSRRRRSSGSRLKRNPRSQRQAQVHNRALKRARLSRRQQEAKLRGFAAINRVRRGESTTLSHAARIEGTILATIRRVLPAALLQGRPGERIRVKAGDPYSARVEIITDLGPLVVNARGSRERELAGRHRAVVIGVLREREPASTLNQFRGKKVGGRKLISDSERLLKMARGGELDHLEDVYVSPGT
jgi:hypothetical protein